MAMQMCLPAQSLKQYVVTLSPVFDSSEQSKRWVSPEVVVKLYVIQVLDGDPAEYGPRLLHVACASTN